ncbi:MAG TPA: hypothetical protein VFU14_15770, partial [Acidimicrobiales bacterium]|nr:hypothetical protein [Acidimicrobiales bacterium]
ADPLVAAGPLRVLAVASVLVSVAVLAAQAWLLRPGGTGDTVLDRSVLLLRGPLAATVRARAALTAAGGIGIPLLVLCLLAEPHPPAAAIRALAALGAALVVRGELAGRTLFFRSMTSPRMPGIPR